MSTHGVPGCAVLLWTMGIRLAGETIKGVEAYRYLSLCVFHALFVLVERVFYNPGLPMAGCVWNHPSLPACDDVSWYGS